MEWYIHDEDVFIVTNVFMCVKIQLTQTQCDLKHSCHITDLSRSWQSVITNT